MIEQLRARRVELTTQMDRARLEYADLEEIIKRQQQELALRQRQIDMMHGAVQELDRLLAIEEQEMPDQLHIDDLPPQAQSFAVQLSSNDQRFTATCRDATGRIFVAWHDANLNIVLCEDVGDRLKYVAGPVPGSKDSCVSLLIAEDDYVRVYYGGRAAGEISGAFPLRREVYRVEGVRVATGGDAALAGRVGALEKVYQDLSTLVGRVVSVLKGIGAALGG